MLFHLLSIEPPSWWLLWLVCTSLLTHQLVVDASYGIRQRNSSLPLRQSVNKSKSRATNLNFLAYNSHICAYCDTRKCEEEGESEDKQGQQLFCFVIKQGDEMPEESCGGKEQLQRILRQKYHTVSLKSGAQGCQSRQTPSELWKICWCHQNKLESQPQVGLTENEEKVFSPVQRRSRLFNAKNGLHSRASRYHDVRAQSPSYPSSTSTWFILLSLFSCTVSILIVL